MNCQGFLDSYYSPTMEIKKGMVEIIDLARHSDENERQYIWRLASAKDSGLLDMTWEELTDVFNKELREEDKEYNSSAYRKPYQQAKEYYQDVFSKMVDGQYSKEIQVQKDELYKVKKQVSDQYREYNKLLALDSRADNLTEELVRVANMLNKERPLNFTDYIKDVSDKESVLFLADWHYGMVTDNIWNTYNTEICKQRVEKLVNKSKEYLELNKVRKLHIVLMGDECHGGIHNSARVKSEEDVCDQLMKVAEIIAQAVEELSSVTNEIDVHSTYGNHMRSIQNKNDSIHSDNMEKIIPWWLEQRLQKNTKVSIKYSEFKEFTRLDVLGYKLCCVHGDLDNIKNVGVVVNTIFSRLYNETIDYTISADKHHLEEFESFDIENVLVRSLCGTDDYANDKRLYSKAGQTLMIFSKEDGRQCTYNIKLN